MEGMNVELVLKKEFVGINKYILSVIYFDNFKYVVTADIGGYIFIWIIGKKCEILKKLEEDTPIHEDSVNDLLKWNERTFLSCSEDMTVKSFELISKSPFCIKNKEFNGFRGRIYRINRLSDDIFVTIDRSSDVKLVSYSKTEIIKKVVNENKIHWDSNIFQSILYKNSFYLSHADNHGIKLINYEENKVINRFEEHADFIYCINAFLDHKKQEILIAGSYENNIYFYRTTTTTQEEKKSKKKLINTFKTDIKSMRLISVNYFSQLLVFSVDVTGYFNLYLLKDKKINNFKQIFEEKIHSDYIFCIRLLSSFKNKKNKNFKILTCCRDGFIKIHNLNNNLFEIYCKDNEYEQIDVIERLQFLTDNSKIDSIYKEEKEEIFSIIIKGSKNYKKIKIDIFKIILRL